MAQTLWSAPADLYLPASPPTSASGSVGQPFVGSDASGNTIAVWSDWLDGSVSVVRAARFSGAAGTWGASVTLSTSAQSSLEARVAVASSGDAVAIWQQLAGARSVLHAARFTAATASWGAAVAVSGLTDDDVLPEIDVDADGDALAVWVRQSDGTRVYAARYAAASDTWGASVAVSTAGLQTIFPHVGLDSAGNAIAVWVSGIAQFQAVIKAARFSVAGSGWLAPVEISLADRFAYAPDVAVDAAGNATAVWTYSNASTPGSVVQSARFSATSLAWSAVATLTEMAAQMASPHVAVGDAGAVTAAWHVDTGVVRFIQSARYNGAWSSPAMLSDGVTTGSAEPRVAVDLDGRAIVSWRDHPTGGLARIRASFYSPVAGSWSAGAVLSSPTEASESPAVALGTGRRAVTVWRTTQSSANHATGVFTTLPDGPVLQPALVSFPEVTLQWIAPSSGPSPTAYLVVASASPSGRFIAQLPAGNATGLLVAAPAGTYYVRVFAAMGGDVVPSNEVRVDVTTGPLPTAPLALSGTVSGSLVNLTWNPPANAGIAPVQTYVVEAGSQPAASDLANFATGTPTSGYAAMVPEGNYYVRVRASRVIGLGPPTPDVRVVVGPPPPDAPGLRGGSTGPGGVVLTWTAAAAPGAPVTAYQLQAGSLPGQSDIAMLTLSASQLGYAAAGIPAGTYHVRIVGLSAQGPGTPSNELVVTIP